MTTPGPDLKAAQALFRPHWFEAPDLPVQLVAVLPDAQIAENPDFPFAARPQAGRIASGRGLTRDEALRRALGEAVELVACARNGMGDTGSEPPGGTLICAGEVLRFSPLQYRHRAVWNARWGQDDPWPEERPAAGPCHTGKDLITGADLSVISDLVWIGGAGPDDHNPLGSEGCASGPTKQAAVSAALAELFESDAIGRWWWGHAPAGDLSLDLLESMPDFQHALERRSRITRLMSLHSPAGVPVVAAVSHKADGTRVACGFAAAALLRDAACAAALELADSELRLRMAEGQGPDHPLTPWVAHMTTADQRFQPRPDLSPPQDITSLRDACEIAGGPFAVFDMTRPEWIAPAVRIIAPGLCSQRPRFLNCPAGDRMLAGLARDDTVAGPEHGLPLLV